MYNPKIGSFQFFYEKRKENEEIRQPQSIYVLDVYPLKLLPFGYNIDGITDDGKFHENVPCQAEAGSNSECWQEHAI